MSSHPDFNIGGPPRAATGWMLSCLQEHLEAFVPPREANYFGYEYSRPATWYRDRFDDCAPGQTSGEKSPSHLAHPEAPARIHRWNPDIHLVFSLRHPVDRTYAAYCMLLQNPHYDFSDNVEQVLTPEAALVQDSRYFEHLQRYRSYFPEEQIHVLIFDDLRNDAHQFAQQLFRAMSIDPSFEPSRLNRKYGNRRKRGGALWSAVQEFIIRLSRASDWASRFIRWCRKQGYTDWIHRIRPGKDYPALPESVRERLKRYYHDDVERLRSYLGRELPDWP